MATQDHAEANSPASPSECFEDAQQHWTGTPAELLTPAMITLDGQPQPRQQSSKQDPLRPPALSVDSEQSRRTASMVLSASSAEPPLSHDDEGDQDEEDEDPDDEAVWELAVSSEDSRSSALHQANTDNNTTNYGGKDKDSRRISNADNDKVDESAEDETADDAEGGLMSDLGIENVQWQLLEADKAAQELELDMRDCQRATDLFLDSQFQACQDILRPYFKKRLMHTIGFAIIGTLRAIMTAEPRDLKQAVLLLKVATECAHHYRKKESSIMSNLTTFVKGVSLVGMTVLQRHAELVYAEAYLLKAILTILTDETLVSLIREGINIRSSYLTYKSCMKWLLKSQAGLQKRGNGRFRSFVRRTESGPAALPVLPKEDGSRTVDYHFVGGVYLGIGCFNLIISLLPPRVLKIFEFIGFSGSRSYALNCLEAGHAQSGVRDFLCRLVLMAYHVVIAGLVPFVSHDLAYASDLIQGQLSTHPRGTFYLLLNARLLYMQRHISEAVPAYLDAMSSQSEWVQLRHVCRWELNLCYTILWQFEDARDQMEILARESRWSKAIYTYLLVANKLSIKEFGPTHVKVDNEEIKNLLEKIPGFMRKIAGKRIPLEKFVARKARKFSMQNNYLFLPSLEMLIFRNGYAHMDTLILAKFLNCLDAKLVVLHGVEKNPSASIPPYHDHLYDDIGLAYLLRGIVCRQMELHSDSLSAFEQVLSLEKKLKLDHYLAPVARFEMGRLYLDMIPARTQEARQQFETARKDYKKYSMESWLHFRLHAALRRVDELESGSVSEGIADELDP